jgi:hypothetical protein
MAFEQAKRRYRRLPAVPIGGEVFTFRVDLRGWAVVEELPTG